MSEQKAYIIAMPGKNTVKCYVAGGFYHVYNRGVAKQIIFSDERDYAMMIHCVKRHLSPDLIVDKLGRPYKKLDNQIRLHAYCLMPNHYHFLVQQLSDSGMEQFMRRVMTAYTMYFNWRNDRVGGLFQGAYKARLIKDDADFLNISRYIHENPQEVWTGKSLDMYPYSSSYFYKSQPSPDWLTTEYVQGHTLQGVTL